MKLRAVFGVLFFAGLLCAQLPDRAAQIKAFHERNDQEWAQKSGLPASQVRVLRMAAGIEDSTDGRRIVQLDAGSLKSRHQILLVEGYCLKLHVLESRGDGFQDLVAQRIPRAIVEDRGRHRTGRSAHLLASARSAQRPRYRRWPHRPRSPVMLDPFERSIPVRRYTYAWDGGAYRLADEAR